MKGIIKQESEHYYSAIGWSLGSTSKQRLVEWMRKNGCTEIEYIPLPRKQSTVWNPITG